MNNPLIGIGVELQVPVNDSRYSEVLTKALGGMSAEGMVVLADYDGELQVLTDDGRLVSSMEYDVRVLDAEALRTHIINRTVPRLEAPYAWTHVSEHHYNASWLETDGASVFLSMAKTVVVAVNGEVVCTFMRSVSTINATAAAKRVVEQLYKNGLIS